MKRDFWGHFIYLGTVVLVWNCSQACCRHCKRITQILACYSTLLLFLILKSRTVLVQVYLSWKKIILKNSIRIMGRHFNVKNMDRLEEWLLTSHSRPNFWCMDLYNSTHRSSWITEMWVIRGTLLKCLGTHPADEKAQNSKMQLGNSPLITQWPLYFLYR